MSYLPQLVRKVYIWKIRYCGLLWNNPFIPSEDLSLRLANKEADGPIAGQDKVRGRAKWRILGRKREESEE